MLGSLRRVLERDPGPVCVTANAEGGVVFVLAPPPAEHKPSESDVRVRRRAYARVRPRAARGERPRAPETNGPGVAAGQVTLSRRTRGVLA
jgi:hypothetical protein